MNFILIQEVLAYQNVKMVSCSCMEAHVSHAHLQDVSYVLEICVLHAIMTILIMMVNALNHVLPRLILIKIIDYALTVQKIVINAQTKLLARDVLLMHSCKKMVPVQRFVLMASLRCIVTLQKNTNVFNVRLKTAQNALNLMHLFVNNVNTHIS